MDAVAIFKALGDASRLEMIREIIAGPVPTEILCEKLKLAPSTISHHANKLLKAGLIESRKEQQSIIYFESPKGLNCKLKDLIMAEKDSEIVDGRKDSYRKKVINHFVEFGRLKQIPVQRKKRKIILEQILTEFEEDKKYSEKEVNEILKNWHEDYCYLRREMISENLLSRENSRYWRVKE